MPPSVNASLRPTNQTGRFVKTEASTLFDKRIITYRAINWRKLEEISKTLKEWIAIDKYNVIHLHRAFHFCEKRIFTKTKGSKFLLQKLDTSNFEKLSTDGISLLLGIDDRYFKSMSFDTIPILNNQPEHISAVFQIIKLRGIQT